MKKKVLLIISSLLAILLILIIILTNGDSDKKQLDTYKNQEVSGQAVKEVEEPKVSKVEVPKDNKEVKAKANQNEAKLTDKAILTTINNAQESFFKITRNVKEFQSYGILSEEFN